MTSVVIFSTLFGGLLGRRFNVFVLFPAMLVGVVLSVGVAAAEGTSIWETLPTLGMSMAGLQVGYVANCLALNLVPDQQLMNPNDGMVKVENLIEHQDVELEVARKQLDAMVPALMTLSRQMTERPAAETRTQDPSPAAACGSARSKAS